MKIDVMDMNGAVQGRGGKMYPLLLRRTEDGGPDFILDVNEDALVVVPDVNSISAGKGIAVILLFAIVLIIGVVLGFLPMLLEDASKLVFPLIMVFLVAVLGAAAAVFVFRAVRNGDRLEPILFNRLDQTVTHYSGSEGEVYNWSSLKPFIRIIQVVHAAGGSVTYQLILADVEDDTGKVRSEFVAGKGDLIGAGAHRFGFFQVFMEGSLSDLPRFQLVSSRMGWLKRMAVSIWTLGATRKCLLGQQPWTPAITLVSLLWTVLLMPFQLSELIAAWISKGPFGVKETGPWPSRFDALKDDSVLKSKADRYGDVTPISRIIIVIALALGVFVWILLFGLFYFAIQR
ncbi:hypothetical protein [Stenotrophomonas maltophilia]|uniref:hypothetical protein n=1 Tax=Stenotrophomonas maltophilia TaxID=40324 RepID=UPI0025F9C3A8|nr:hypothetical protein [uncultured Stenotrophomonas sp.]